MTAGIWIRTRYMSQRGLGPVKWDVDGNRYVDYFGGHGSLLLGHNHPTVMAAIHAALDFGTHFGACHEQEVRWAKLITQMVPSAERVRFTASGTEATLMALRLARAYTGRSKLVRFRGHFHGWHDHMTSGQANHFDGTATSGVVDGVADNVLLCDPNDVAGITRICSTITRISRPSSWSRPARVSARCRSCRRS